MNSTAGEVGLKVWESKRMTAERNRLNPGSNDLVGTLITTHPSESWLASSHVVTWWGKLRCRGRLALVLALVWCCCLRNFCRPGDVLAWFFLQFPRRGMRWRWTLIRILWGKKEIAYLRRQEVVWIGVRLEVVLVVWLGGGMCLVNGEELHQVAKFRGNWVALSLSEVALMYCVSVYEPIEYWRKKYIFQKVEKEGGVWEDGETFKNKLEVEVDIPVSNGWELCRKQFEGRMLGILTYVERMITWRRISKSGFVVLNMLSMFGLWRIELVWRYDQVKSCSVGIEVSTYGNASVYMYPKLVESTSSQDPRLLEGAAPSYRMFMRQRNLKATTWSWPAFASWGCWFPGSPATRNSIKDNERQLRFTNVRIGRRWNVYFLSVTPSERLLVRER